MYELLFYDILAKKIKNLEDNMPKDTNENAILSKLKYIGLDLENIPDFLKEVKKFDYKPLKTVQDNEYKVYKYIPISKIRILLTPCNRLNTIAEKYKKADAISAYLDSKSEENIMRYTMFLKMLNQVDIAEIEKLEKLQAKLQTQIPFFVKFHENYLWQIYYSDIQDIYFMMVPTEDLDYAAFFYLLKKQIEIQKNHQEEWVYVPISYEPYSTVYLKNSQIADLEKYIWFFTKEWPMIYEVYDKENNVSIHIVGKTPVYEELQSEYKVVLKTKEEAQKFYKLQKALFILSTELPHYYQFETKIDILGSLEYEYNKTKVTYEGLMELLTSQYEKAKRQIEELQEKNEIIEKELEKIKKETLKKEEEYLIKEKQIATYLECKKTFFGKVRYFLKARKMKKEGKEEIQENEKEQKPKQERKENETVFAKKEYYTIEDIVQIYKSLDTISQTIKKIELDIDAQKRKKDSLSKKIENASLYIQEIDKHEKSIFEFWKFTNKDEQMLLQEGEEEKSIQENKLEKTFHYEEDLEEIGILLDTIQRNQLTKSETDALFIASTELLAILNDYENEEAFIRSLEDLKKQAENERILFNQENFDLFGNITEDSTKIQMLAGKKHRETKKDKLKILEITKNLTLEEYKDKMLEILKDIYEALKKSKSPISIPVYYASEQKLEENFLQVFSIKPEEVIQPKKEEKELNLYRFNIKKDMSVIYYTNYLYYDNHNKTLPVGMDITTKCLINLSSYNLNLASKKEFRITRLTKEEKVDTLKINVLEYDIRKKD